MLYPTRSGVVGDCGTYLHAGWAWVTHEVFLPQGRKTGSFLTLLISFDRQPQLAFTLLPSFHSDCIAAPGPQLKMTYKCLCYSMLSLFYVMLWLFIVELFQSKVWWWWRLFLHCNEIQFILTSRRVLSLLKKVFVPLFPSIWNEQYIVIGGFASFMLLTQLFISQQQQYLNFHLSKISRILYWNSKYSETPMCGWKILGT